MAVALATPGYFAWDVLVWAGAVMLLALVVAAFVRFVYPPWFRRWLNPTDGRK